MPSDFDTGTHWSQPPSVTLEWNEDGSTLVRLTVVQRDGSTAVVDLEAVSRGRLLPAVIEVTTHPDVEVSDD